MNPPSKPPPFDDAPDVLSQQGASHVESPASQDPPFHNGASPPPLVHTKPQDLPSDDEASLVQEESFPPEADLRSLQSSLSPAPPDALPLRLQALQHYQALLRKIPKLPERIMRREVFGEHFLTFSVGIQVEVLHFISIHCASSHEASALLVAFQDQDQAHHQLDYEERRQIYEIARHRGYPHVQRLFLSLSPSQSSEKPMRPHHQLAGLTLGERKSLARGHNIGVLEKLLLDPDPAVIRNLLQNPRITEKEILYIVTRRPSKAAVLDEVSRHPRWFHRFLVRIALCKNPYTPPAVALRLLPELPAPELREIAHTQSLHPEVISRAAEILRLREVSASLSSLRSPEEG